MSKTRSDRSSSNRDYIPLENSASEHSSTDSSSEEVEFSETRQIILSELNGQAPGIPANEDIQSDIIASGDTEEVNGGREVPIVRIASEISSGYLASNESSSGADSIDFSNESAVTPSSSEATSIEKENNLDLVTFRKTLIVDIAENAVNSVEMITVHQPQNVDLPTPIVIKPIKNSKRSQSADSFFTKMKATSFGKDSSNLYRLTINVKNPCEFIPLCDSFSLESLIARKSIITNGPLECADSHGDNTVIIAHQFEKKMETSADKKIARDFRSSDRQNFLRSLNALYPSNMKAVNYDVYVNEEKEPATKQDKLSVAKSTIYGNSKVPRPRGNSVVSVEQSDKGVVKDPHKLRSISAEDKNKQKQREMGQGASEIISFLTNTEKPGENTPNLPSTKRNSDEPLRFTYYRGFADYDNLIGKLDQGNNPFGSNHLDKEHKTVEFPSLSGSTDNSCSLAKESAERIKKLSLNLNSSEESKEMAELFYIGDSKSDDGENRSDKYTSSETFESLCSKESSGSSKWTASNPDPDTNNNYILSQTSSDDSMGFEDDCKFQFTKDISGKEEYLRQNLTLSEERFNSPTECRKSVSFKNDYPVYFPARLNYLRTRKLDTDSSPKSTKSTVDVASATDIFDESHEELQRFSDEFVLQQKVIDEAEKSSYKLLRDLQCLWMNVSDMGGLPSVVVPQTDLVVGEHSLIQQIQLCIFIADQMNQNQDWRTSAVDITGTEKLQELQNANKYLKEQLDSCRIIQNCLESEINYAAKEKALLNDEVKHLSYQLAARICKVEKSVPTSPITSPKSTDTSSYNCGKSQEENVFTNENEQSKQNFVKKREDDFSSIMDCVRDRKGVMNTLNSQLDKYQDDVKSLKKQIENTNEDKERICQSYEILLEEKRVAIRDRNHFESILKLITGAKNKQEFQDLLERVMTKLSTFTDNDGKSSSFFLWEGALQAVQEQNVSYCEEIAQLREKISDEAEQHLLIKSELESSVKKVSQKVEELKLTIEDKNEIQKSQEKKLTKLQELEAFAKQAKATLDRSLEEKDIEIAKLREAYEDVCKAGTKQHRKVHELQKLNSKLTRETYEHRRNIEQLGSIINQLRQNLADQKTQYTQRVNSIGDEVMQSKEHCRWLQSQIDHMNNQLEDAHGRIKAHEREKTSLAQQVLSAEEERQVVDRNLNELKAALESDLVLRQALIERNETLQIEINRLRKAQITGLSPLMSSMPNQEGEFGNPPSELSSITDGLSSLNSYPMPDYKLLTAGDRRKNRHSTPYRKGNEAPRAAVSLHTANATGLSGHGNVNNSVDINAGGAACSPFPE